MDDLYEWWDGALEGDDQGEGEVGPGLAGSPPGSSGGGVEGLWWVEGEDGESDVAHPYLARLDYELGEDGGWVEGLPF